MRFTFVGPVPPLPGGISHHSDRLVAALRNSGHEVEVISWRSQYPRFLYKGPRIDDAAQPLPGATFLLSWWNPISWWRARLQASATIVIFSYVTPFHALQLRVVAGGSKRSVGVVHNVRPHEQMPFEKLLVKLALGGSDRLVVHGARAAADLKDLGLGSDVAIVPMPPTLEIAPSPLPSQPPLGLLFFGFVRPYKGLGVAISAVKHLMQNGIDARLTVMGSFWEPIVGYQSQIESLGLGERVELREGYVSDRELADALRSHHIVVAPYLEDTLSGVIPVALSAGRPVVSTKVEGVSEQVEDSLNGILVPAGDPGAFAGAIEKVAENLAAMARAAAESTPTWSAVADVVAAPWP